MTTLKTAIGIAWIVFWVYWLGSAVGAKESQPSARRIPLFGITAISVAVLIRVLRHGALAVNSPVLGAVGTALFVAGIGVAIWARVYLGSNWGMPMTQRQEPELVTSGPYRFVRHPIYSGLLLAFVGTALATNFIGLIIALVLGAYFVYSATVEEKNLAAAFPATYPAYRAGTKMLIPFVL